jgi:hypothetical protein
LLQKIKVFTLLPGAKQCMGNTLRLKGFCV